MYIYIKIQIHICTCVYRSLSVVPVVRRVDGRLLGRGRRQWVSPIYIYTHTYIYICIYRYVYIFVYTDN